jgi:hypothetical protein
LLNTVWDSLAAGLAASYMDVDWLVAESALSRC